MSTQSTPEVLVPTEEFLKLQQLKKLVVTALTQQGDDVCWRDLYNAEVAELVGVPFDPALLPAERFLRNCEHFHARLAANAPYTPKPAIAADVAEPVRKALAAVIEYNWNVEWEDAQENGLSGHVFRPLAVLDNWLKGTNNTPESYFDGEWGDDEDVDDE